MWHRAFPVCAMLLALSVSAGAQATGTGETRTREEVVRERAEAAQARARAMTQRMVTDTVAMNRAVLGVTLAQTGNRRDTLGVFISAVATDGPAERAGIVEGDRIAMINNVDVRTQASDIGDSYLAGVGQARLRSEMRRLTPGQRVNVRIWSGGRYRDVQITTGRYADVYRHRRTVINIGEGGMMFPVPPVPPVPPVAPLAPGQLLRLSPGATGPVILRAPVAHPRPARIVPAPISPSIIRLEEDLDDLGLVLADLGETITASVTAALAPLAAMEPDLWNTLLPALEFDYEMELEPLDEVLEG
jgi:hypothetical protein